MQVGNTFIDVKVVGYDKNNIVTLDNMKLMRIVETSGTSLPYLYGSFYTYDRNLADYFQLNNTLQIGIGDDASNADYFTVYLIDSPKDQDSSSSGWLIEFGGFLGPTTYMMNKVSKAYKGNSLLVTKQVIEENFKILPKLEISEVNENQVVWRQTYETTSSFLINTLMHMDIRPSFPLFTFNKKGEFCLKSFDKIKEETPKVYFVPFKPSESNQIQYLNNFNVDSYKPEYNLFSGYNKVTEVYKATSGMSSYVIDDNTPILASTQQTEQFQSGNRVSLNKIQSSNVHNTYNEAYAHNVNKLLSMSSMQGVLKLAGGYYKNLQPLDLVFVNTGKDDGSDGTIDALYLIDTIVTDISFVTNNLTTYVYVTRDNKNNVENYVTQKSNKIKIKKSFLEELANSVSDVRVATALCSEIMSGDYLNRLKSFAIESKNNILRLFSVADVMLDFTGQIEYLKNALFVGNSLMNSLLFSLFPYSIAETLRDFLIRKPSERELLGKYIADYVPMPIQAPISRLADSMCSVHTSLNSIAEDNGITAVGIVGETLVVATNTVQEAKEEASFVAREEADQRVIQVIQGFENNTTGLDIPFPLISLTESQQLLPDEELKRYIADETILNLTELGYMEGVNIAEFKNILLGLSPIEFSIIQKINENAGVTLNYRYWGTFGHGNDSLFAWTYEDNLVYTKTLDIQKYTRLFNENYTPYEGTSFKIITEDDGDSYKVVYEKDNSLHDTSREETLDVNSDVLSQLTSFYVQGSFKDRYRTIPCTKLISATKNSHIFFACPEKEKNIKFYINSKRVILGSFLMDLGYKDTYGNVILYRIYYTSEGYNSNSVLFEIRQ